MRVKLILFLLILNVATVKAKEVNDINCITPEYLTTSMSLQSTNKGSYDLIVSHHNGVEYAPIHKGIVTSKDIEYLSRKSEIIKSLGANYKIKFKASKCNFSKDNIGCYSNEKLKVNNLNLRRISFHLIKEQVVTPYGVYDSWLAYIDVSRQGDNFIYSTVMRYSSDQCFFSLAN